MRIQVEISLYPLGEQDTLRVIELFLDVLRADRLKPQVGTMSTIVVGESEAVFPAVAKAFERVGIDHRCILVAKYSNASPPIETTKDAGALEKLREAKQRVTSDS